MSTNQHDHKQPASPTLSNNYACPNPPSPGPPKPESSHHQDWAASSCHQEQLSRTAVRNSCREQLSATKHKDIPGCWRRVRENRLSDDQVIKYKNSGESLQQVRMISLWSRWSFCLESSIEQCIHWPNAVVVLLLMSPTPLKSMESTSWRELTNMPRFLNIELMFIFDKKTVDDEKMAKHVGGVRCTTFVILKCANLSILFGICRHF